MKRLFVGSFVSLDLSELKRNMENLDILGRWVKSENLHVTYSFLGNVKEEVVPQVESLLVNGLTDLKQIDVSFSGLGVFPNVKAAKVLWVGLESEGLNEVHQRVQSALKPLGFHNRRPFKPHVTVMRLRKVRHRIRFSNFLNQMKGYRFTGNFYQRIALVESELTPNGSNYNILREVKLK